MKTHKFIDKRILVTGGAGFIGSELVHQLNQEGAEVVVIDNLSNGKRENLVDILGDKVELVVADIQDRNVTESLLQSVDLVYHLACLGVRHSVHSPIENHDVNASATLELLKLSRENHVSRFVYCSTSEVYGGAQKVPITENHPAFPKTVYGASKLAGECYARAFYSTHGFPTVVVRPFNTYGPRSHHEGDSGEVIPKFILRAMTGRDMIIFGDGTQTRDFSYVSDTAHGILMAGIVEEASGKTINLGYGTETNLNDLAVMVSEVVGKPETKITYNDSRPGDVLRLLADNTKAKDILGYVPKVTLREGLKILYQWYLKSDQKPEDLLKEDIIQNWEKDAS